jgi:hypothetical protein
MKEDLQTISPAELRKNLLTGATLGAVLGLGLGVSFGSFLLGLPVGILAGLAVGFRLSRLPIKMRYPMPLVRRMLLTGALAMLTGLGYALLLDRGLPRTQLILAALVPTAAIAGFVIVIGTAIASLDELQRRIQTEAIAIGFAGTAIICAGYGLISTAGLRPLNWALVTMVMAVMWLAGKLWTMWKYR